MSGKRPHMNNDYGYLIAIASILYGYNNGACTSTGQAGKPPSARCRLAVALRGSFTLVLVLFRRPSEVKSPKLETPYTISKQLR
eukprot:scaffold575373_cov17-Prasinocladus_malaysianus.AAC.1